jgi:hypothetical protein
MNEIAKNAPVVYVLRVVDYDYLSELTNEDAIDEILGSGSVYRTLEGARKAAEDDYTVDVEDYNADPFLEPDEIMVPSIKWKEDTYTDYGGVKRAAHMFHAEEFTRIYRVIEVILHG